MDENKENHFLIFFFLTIFRFRVGPIFGAGADLQIANACNCNMDSYSNLPHSYDGGNNASSSSLFGDYNFAIHEYEVYTLASAPSPPSPPASKFKGERF